MDELDLFRDFRRGVAVPSEHAHRRASALLGRALDREQTPRTSALRLIAKRPGYSALALAALAGATAAALFVSAPWKDSPGFLARAQAALTPPAGTVLHYKWEVISTWPSPACAVTRGPNEIWIDQEPPHTYRALLDDPPPAGAHPSSLACWPSGPLSEFGGTIDPACSPAEQPNCTTQETLEFVPPDTLSVSPLQFVLPPDPVTMLREAISAGNAYHVGKTQLDGRTVERIRIDSPSACALPSCPPADVYVDPETFHPVQVEGPTSLRSPRPDDSPALSPHLVVPPPDAVVERQFVDRYLTFEYLPRTAANLALTDIRAQHPNATVVDPMDD